MQKRATTSNFIFLEVFSDLENIVVRGPVVRGFCIFEFEPRKDSSVFSLWVDLLEFYCGDMRGDAPASDEAVCGDVARVVFFSEGS
jgi:hypothetical protein